jgi:Zn-dependent peptidase ImmA (M78 family)/DNA-binding XRE family transcriptional regulator
MTNIRKLSIIYIIMATCSLDGLLNPNMLRWVRIESAMDVETVAKKSKKSVETINEWEQGAKTPTLTQLRRLAKIYKRSVGIFFLKEIPKSSFRPIDFRRLEVSSRSQLSSALANGLREAEAKRNAALELFINLEQPIPAWDLQLPDAILPEAAAQIILKRLGINMEMRSKWADQYQALNGWKSAVESLGIIVVQLSGIDIKEMRGCSLSLFPLPIIVLNSSDSPLGRIFTLIHELTHLAKGQSGLCDMLEDVPRPTSLDAIEVFCNYVAGSVLVPAKELLDIPIVGLSNSSTEWDSESLSEFRRLFWVSKESILRRLLILKRTSPAHYKKMRVYFEEEYKKLNSSGMTGHVPYFRKVILNNGTFLTRLVLRAYGSEIITGSEVSRILNVKLDHLPKIREALNSGVRA